MLRKDGVGRGFLEAETKAISCFFPISQTGERRESNIIMKEIKWKRKGFPLDRVGARNLQIAQDRAWKETENEDNTVNTSAEAERRGEIPGT